MRAPSSSQGEGPCHDPSPGREPIAVHDPKAEAGNRSSGSQSLCRDQRLRRRADYLRCYRRGQRRHGALTTVHFHPNQLQESRLGITASRKVGKAVVRHRIKRRIREIYRRWPRRPGLAGLDLVVHVKRNAATATFSELEGELGRLLASLGRRESVRNRSR